MGEPIEETVSPWMPEQDRIRLAVLGKLIEECNELSARAARCIIQGIDETDPDTGRTNRAELAREVADVWACLNVLVAAEDVRADGARLHGKVVGFGRWHRLISQRDSLTETAEAMAEQHLGAR